MPAAKPKPRRKQNYLLTVSLETTEGVAVERPWWVGGGSEDVIFASEQNQHNERFTAGFTTDAANMRVTVVAFGDDNVPIFGSKVVVLQVEEGLEPFESQPIDLRVRPIIASKRLKLAQHPDGPAFPNLEDLEQQLASMGLTVAQRHGDPRLEFILPDKWFATVRYIEPKLLVQQIR